MNTITSKNMPAKQPLYLVPGSRVWVVAASSLVPQEAVRKGIQVLESWNLEVKIGSSVWDQFGTFAGPDAARQADLQQALNDPEARAIFFCRGGYGLTRIIDQLDWQAFQTSPKWLIGFSDLTAIHLAAHQLGYASIHGPMVVHLANLQAIPAIFSLKRMLFGEQNLEVFSLQTKANLANGFHVDAPMVGGNLTMLAHSLGSGTPVQSAGKILFLEEIAEPGYKCDRLLVQLHRAGLLRQAAAICLGQFTDCNRGEFPFDVVQSLANLLGDDFPVFYGLPMGHGSLSYPFVHGAEYQLKKREGQWQLVLSWTKEEGPVFRWKT